MTLSGFVDLHSHGMGRFSTKTAIPDEILGMAELHGRAGTSIIVPTVYSGSIDEMRKNMDAIKKAMELQKYSCAPHMSRIAGVNLEGPFLNPLYSGAQNKRSFVKPSVSALTKLVSGYEDVAKMITVAPELPGSLRVIEKCTELGIRVNMGHSDATFRQASEGKKAGAQGITHLFNAMRVFHHREPGLAGFGLMDQDLYVEVIADGVHIHRVALTMIFGLKRIDRIILISDSVKGRKDRRGAVYSPKGVLLGSCSPLSGAVKVLNSINIRDGDILKVARDNPSRYIGPEPDKLC